MAAGAVPETAEPGVRTRHLRGGRPVEQFDRRADRRPFAHPLLGQLEASRRMHRLDPARLLGFGGNVIFADGVEQILRAVAQHRVEALAGRAMAGHHGGGIVTRQRRNDLTIVAARSAPAGLGGLDHHDLDPGLAQMDRRR